MYQFDDFVSLVREKINLEKYIAVTCNKEEEFRNKWKLFSVVIKLYCVLFLLNFCIFVCFFSLPYLFNNLLNSRKLKPLRSVINKQNSY